MERIVYSDNAATTPISKNVYEAMIPYLTDRYGNPSSLYARGREEKKAVDQARIYTAEIINADPSEIIFTSGGSEADNLAIKGLLFSRQLPKNKKHIITSKIEHHAILNCTKELESQGYLVTLPGKGTFAAPSQEVRQDRIDQLWQQLDRTAAELRFAGVTDVELADHLRKGDH